jgi:hypothetical protein
MNLEIVVYGLAPTDIPPPSSNTRCKIIQPHTSPTTYHKIAGNSMELYREDPNAIIYPYLYSWNFHSNRGTLRNVLGLLF